MRHTQPLTADEERIDSALRKQHRTHADQDRALTLYRAALRFNDERSFERVADLMLGERAL